jgi:hypothetical protein
MLVNIFFIYVMNNVTMANIDASGSGSQAPDDDDGIDQEFISTLLPISKSMSRTYARKYKY